MGTNSQNKDRQIIAVSSGWLVGGTLVLWGCSVLFIVVLTAELTVIPDSYRNPTLMGVIIFALIVVVCGAIFYTYNTLVTPNVLAEYCCGMILLHPTKSQTVTLRPEEIVFVAQSNYHGKVSYKSGKITVQTAKGDILIRWVKDVNAAREKIEFIRGTAILRLQSDSEK